MVGVQHAFVDQAGDGFADGNTGNVEPGRKFTLRRQGIVRLQGMGGNRFADG